MEKVTIYTGWGGENYAADYVNRLYRACKRNMTMPFDFVLLCGPSADAHSLDRGIEIIETGLPFWWSGMVFWSPDIVGRRLFLDLDVVVVGSLDALFSVDSDFCCSRDWASHNAPIGGERDANPGVTLLKGNAGRWVWDEYVNAGKPTWNPMDKSVDHSPCHLAAQGIINNRGGVDLFPQDLCASYKFTAQRRGVPEGCATVHFHGRPKPHEVNHGWVVENWR